MSIGIMTEICPIELDAKLSFDRKFGSGAFQPKRIDNVQTLRWLVNALGQGADFR